jgi:thioredoxin reductase
VEVTGNGVVCVDKQWRKTVITGDKVIFAVGSRPNDGLLSDLQGRIKELYVIGDARAPGKIIDAVSEAYRLARSI